MNSGAEGTAALECVARCLYSLLAELRTSPVATVAKSLHERERRSLCNSEVEERVQSNLFALAVVLHIRQMVKNSTAAGILEFFEWV